MKGSTSEHQRLVKTILVTCGARPDVRMWSNQTGVARAFDHDGIIRFGLVGSADILGITSDGMFLAIECKTGDAYQSVPQRRFEAMIKEFGGRYWLSREVKDVVDFLDSLHLEPIENLR